MIENKYTIMVGRPRDIESINSHIRDMNRDGWEVVNYFPVYAYEVEGSENKQFMSFTWRREVHACPVCGQPTTGKNNYCIC